MISVVSRHWSPPDGRFSRSCCETRPLSVMPAQAGIQSASTPPLDSRFRGNDETRPFNARLLGAFGERKVTYELVSNWHFELSGSRFILCNREQK